MPATKFGNLPIDEDRARPWSDSDASARVRAWASSDGSGSPGKIDYAKLRQAYLWYDPAAADQVGAYKLQIADVVDGRLVAVWRAVTAAAAALQGARGGVDLPDSDREGVKAAVARYYAKAAKRWGDQSIQAPWVSQGRSAQGDPWSDFITRAMPLDDLSVRSGHVTCERCGKDATGRMVDAYAAVFNVSAEIRDRQGHYNEIIDPVAFNRTIKNEAHRTGVYYHHAMTLHGTPSGEGSFPLGHPSSIRTDQRGLLTSTHYSANDVGDRALILIKEGTITGQSFSGQIRRSDPQRIRSPLGPRPDGSLPTVRRLELGLREYGPTPSPAYTEAQILATRAAMGLPPDQRSAGLAGWAPSLPPDVEFEAEASRDARAGRQRLLRLRAQLRARGM